MDERGRALASAPLFESLPQAELDRVARALAPRQFLAGNTIVRQGDEPDAAYLITGGEAAVIGVDLIGQEVTLRVFSSGETFGEAGLITGAPRTATVKAKSDVTSFVLTREAFEELRSTCPALVQRLKSYADLLDIDRFLQTASPFQGLTKERIRWIASRMQPRKVARGEIVIREGDEADLFYFIRTGTFEVLKDGKRVQVLNPGDVFGEIALLTGGKRIASVRATSEAEVYTLSKPDFDAAVKESAVARGRLQELTRIRYRATTGQPLALPDPISTVMPFLPERSREKYWKILLAGLALFGIAAFAANATQLHLAIYAALIVGSLVVPVVYVAYLAETGILESRPITLVTTFLLAIPSLAIAAWIERNIGASAGALGTSLLVGVIEEIAKVLAVVWLLRRTTARFQMDGIIFGAAAGMGFAAFETMLFGVGRLQIGTARQDLAVGATLFLVLIRTVLAPLGHGTWTAIVAGTIWRQKSARGIRIDGPVLLALGAAIALHGIYDWQPLPGYLGIAWSVGVGLVGVLLLRFVVQRATQEELTAIVSLNPELTEASPNAPRITCRICEQVSPPGAHYCVRCGSALVGAVHPRERKQPVKPAYVPSFLWWFQATPRRRQAMALVMVLILIPTLILGLLPSQALAASTDLRLLSGSATYAPAGTEAFSEAYDGQILHEGERVVTSRDGHALLTYIDGSHLEMEPMTDLTLTTSRVRGDEMDVRVYQTLGRSWSSMRKLGEHSRYEITTPAATAAVRGTGFEVIVDPNGYSTFKTTDGVVEVSAMGKTVRVPRHYLTHVCVGCQPEDPTFWSEPNKLRIGGHSPVQILITDVAHRTSGDDPEAGIIRQIPRSIVRSTEEPKLIDIEGLEFSGRYEVTIFGTGDGEFKLSASGFDGRDLTNLAFNLVKGRSIANGEILQIGLTVFLQPDGLFDRAEFDQDFRVLRTNGTGDFTALRRAGIVAVRRDPLQPSPPFLLLQLAAGDFSPTTDTGASLPQDQSGLFDPACGGFGPVLTGCTGVSGSPSPSGSPGASASPSASAPASSPTTSAAPTTSPVVTPTPVATSPAPSLANPTTPPPGSSAPPSSAPPTASLPASPSTSPSASPTSGPSPSASASPSPSSSASPSPSDSASPSPSQSTSPSPSQSTSPSPSQSTSPSPSQSTSPSPSGSTSPSPSSSTSPSPSSSTSPSPSSSTSPSPSQSTSPSPSQSTSPSPSGSTSPSPSSSTSPSPSSSTSPSPSQSTSPSPSASTSPSPSATTSPSPSSSTSPSPSSSVSPSPSASASPSPTPTPTPLDTTPPTLVVPGNIYATASTLDGGIVHYRVRASDNSGSVTLACDHPSGSFFALGATLVNCTATDGSGNATSSTFDVTMILADRIAVMPTTATITSGGDKTYRVIAYDPAGHVLADVTATSDFSVAGGTCDGATCTASTAGDHLVTVINGIKVVYATLTVNGTNTAQSDVTIVVAIDANRDGVIDLDELFAPGLGGVTITATSGSTVLQTTTVDGVADLHLAGTADWQICQSVPSGWVQTVPASGCVSLHTPTTDLVTFGDKDGTAPQIAPTVTGTLGSNGWYRSNVQVTWTVTDPQSAITSQSGCATSTVAADGTTVLTCTATSLGGTATASVTIKRDATAPVLTLPSPISTTATSASGATVSYAATFSDATSGPTAATSASCSPASGATFAIGVTTVTCTATDSAGNTASGTFTVTVGVIVVPGQSGGVIDPPFKNNADAVNWGQKEPIKFTITDANGNVLGNLTLHVLFTAGTVTVPGTGAIPFSSQQRKYDLEYDTSNLTQDAGTTVWTVRILTANDYEIVTGTLTVTKSTKK